MSDVMRCDGVDDDGSGGDDGDDDGSIPHKAAANNLFNIKHLNDTTIVESNTQLYLTNNNQSFVYCAHAHACNNVLNACMCRPPCESLN